MTLSWSAVLPRRRRLRSVPKLEYTISTRVPRSCASRMTWRPTSPVIFAYPGAAVRSAPLALWVTLNSPIVVSGVFARWAAMPSSISQYGTKP